MHWQAKIFATGVLLLTLISACSSPTTTTPLPGLEKTLAIRTMAALQGVSYFASATPSPTLLPSQPVFLDVPASHDLAQPTLTAVPSLTPILVNSQDVYTSKECRNRAEFLKDITFSDLSEIKPGQKFTKVWQLRNAGNCAWSPDYSLVFTFGDRMDGLSPKPIGVEVAPGETVNISVDLVAPKEPNYYQGNWMLQDNYGTVFSCGSGARDYFWVSVLVGSKSFKNVFGICGGGG
jgi:hypothetical protein